MSNSLPDNVVYGGSIYNLEELSKYYSMADVFWLCSERETDSMMCAKALCCGTPVVGFKCGVPEPVFKKPYAWFVDYGDIVELGKNLERLLNLKLEDV